MASAHNQRIARGEFRKKLRRWGMPEADIARCVAQVKERQHQKQLGYLAVDAPLCTLGVYVRYLRRQPCVKENGCAPLELGNGFVTPDDKDYRPAKSDSLLSGAGRATGMTAVAVKRRKAMTKFQYDTINGGGDG